MLGSLRIPALDVLVWQLEQTRFIQSRHSLAKYQLVVVLPTDGSPIMRRPEREAA
jgi:hypothetical protein